jgi:agmatine deiminase
MKVFFSDLLPTRFENLSAELFRVLESCGIEWGFLSGTRDVWSRDYMPIARADGRGWVQFAYRPSYLRGYDHLRTEPDEVTAKLPISPLHHSALRLDGGNCIVRNGTAIVTERVYTENPTWSPAHIRREIVRMLGLEKLIMVPDETVSDDMTGHIDGMCRWIDERTVLLNDFALNLSLGNRVFSRLRRAGLRVVRLRVPRSLYQEGYDWAPYINFLETPDVLLVPMLGIANERSVVAQLRHIFHKKKIVPIQANKLIEDGGALNCASWEIL